MKLPRDLTGKDLVHALKPLGYLPTRQVGSHLRLTTFERGEHHVTVPEHGPLRVGTLEVIISMVAGHFAMGHEELVERLFGAESAGR